MGERVIYVVTAADGGTLAAYDDRALAEKYLVDLVGYPGATITEVAAKSDQPREIEE